MTITTGHGAATSQETGHPAEPGDHELARLVQSLPPGDPRRDAACEMLIDRHRSIVWSCARRYRVGPGMNDHIITPAEQLFMPHRAHITEVSAPSGP